VEANLFKEAKHAICVYYGKEVDSYASVGGFVLTLCKEAKELVEDAADVEDRILLAIAEARANLQKKEMADRNDLMKQFILHLEKNRADLFGEIYKEASSFQETKRQKLEKPLHMITQKW